MVNSFFKILKATPNNNFINYKLNDTVKRYAGKSVPGTDS